MRILILGGTGMLGHSLWKHFSVRFPDTYTTIRNDSNHDKTGGLFNDSRVIESVDASDFSELAGVMKCVRPDFVFNCIGVTKRREGESKAIDSIMLNALLPHKLVRWGEKKAVKIINFSTDCVFDGEFGNYTEENPTNAIDLYGKTKALGEIQGNNALTLRSSFIGTELGGAGTELLAWFLSQTGTVHGFKNAIYSGVTTIELSRIVERIVVDYPGANGIYNISSTPISKYDLLMLIKEAMGSKIEIIPNEIFRCNRSLDSTKFRQECNYTPPSWRAMVDELCRVVLRKREQAN